MKLLSTNDPIATFQHPRSESLRPLLLITFNLGAAHGRSEPSGGPGPLVYFLSMYTKKIPGPDRMPLCFCLFIAGTVAALGQLRHLDILIFQPCWTLCLQHACPTPRYVAIWVLIPSG